ncbi:hypothetical protein TNCV_3787561 [Trichonephila clavipes]|nr:hypothetical protein TNCV_3787561 [Trichonephila clavipes]
MGSYDGDDTQTSTSLMIVPDRGVPSLHLRNLDLWEWLVTLTSVPWEPGSNPGKGMDVCKYIVPLWHGVLKIVARRKSSREAGGRGRGWEASDHPRGRNDLNRTVTGLRPGVQSYS